MTKPLLRTIAAIAVVSLSACGSDKANPTDGGRGGAASGGTAGTTGGAGAGGRGGTGGSGTGGATDGRGGGTAGTSGAAGTVGGAGVSGTGGSGTGGSGGTGGAAGATSGTGGAAGATSGAGGRGGTGGTAGGAAGNGGTGGTRVACQSDNDCQLFKCCHGFCVNTRNDIDNCGGCDRPCTGQDPFCSNGTCGTPPCSATNCSAGALCCGSQCCTAGQLCCIVEIGPGFIGCFDPVNGSCPQGCIGGCPCTAPTTPIATPSGARPIADLRVGDLVYSVNGGALAAVPIKLVHHTPVAPDHRVVELRLAHGVVLHVTPNHPTADGRTFGDLSAGDSLDGVPLISARVMPYGQTFTYDILPDSDSGTYVAGGVLIGSALAAPVTGRQAGVDPLRPSRRASLAR